MVRGFSISDNDCCGCVLMGIVSSCLIYVLSFDIVLSLLFHPFTISFCVLYVLGNLLIICCIIHDSDIVLLVY